VLRSYDFTITNSTCNPDGHSGKAKYCQLVNGQYPGPIIHANWGDTVRVTIRNKLQNNGTSIHWHGIRQLRSNQQDGTNGITECPIAPGSSRVYEWQATQYGTSWYHSHHTVQYGEGLLGPIVINGPATANYDEDLGVLPLSDWVYGQAFSLIRSTNHGLGIVPEAQTVLVNGTMVNDSGGGRYTVLKVQKGKTYRLRLINTAVHHFFHVSLDGHPLSVIGADLVPVRPYQTTDLKVVSPQF
jgi:FtsP/CotA-like multicopper oxidase with cupredoxin domain